MGRINEMVQSMVAEQVARATQTQQAPIPPVPMQHQDLQGLSMEAKHLRDFRKNNPRSFDGSLKDPTKAEMWLSSIETIFRYMKCPEDQKLQCAVFTLTENAEIWWQSAERTFDTSTRPITWEGFKEHFYEKCFSAYLRYNKQKEFLDLK